MRKEGRTQRRCKKIAGKMRENEGKRRKRGNRICNKLFLKEKKLIPYYELRNRSGMNHFPY
jgi:hypothetical protein